MSAAADAIFGVADFPSWADFNRANVAFHDAWGALLFCRETLVSVVALLPPAEQHRLAALVRPALADADRSLAGAVLSPLPAVLNLNLNPSGDVR